MTHIYFWAFIMIILFLYINTLQGVFLHITSKHFGGTLFYFPCHLKSEKAKAQRWNLTKITQLVMGGSINSLHNFVDLIKRSSGRLYCLSFFVKMSRTGPQTSRYKCTSLRGVPSLLGERREGRINKNHRHVVALAKAAS